MKKTFTLLLMVSFFAYAFGQVQAPKAQKAVAKKLYKIEQTINKTTSTKAYGDVIWSNDFSNPADWTMYFTGGNGCGWEITTSTDPNIGYGTGPIQSTTAANGYALYDADACGSDGNPEDAYIQTVAPIDLSAYQSVSIRFEQRLRKWQTTQTFVEVSNDSTNWTSFEVNLSTPLSVLETTTLEVNISSAAAGQSQVWIRFHYYGGWDYAWMVDDINVIEGATNDVVGELFSPQFYGAGFYSLLPYNETTPITFFETGVFNNGIYDAVGIYSQTIINDNTSEVYNETTYKLYSDTTNTPHTLAPQTRDTLFSTVAFQPDTTVLNDYTIYMSTGCDSVDIVLDNNSDTMYFSINDTAFARETGIYTTSIGLYRYNGAAIGDAIGTMFYVPQMDTAVSATLYIASNSTEGALFKMDLYYYDQNASAWGLALESDEITLDASMIGQWNTIEFIPDGFSEIMLPGWYAAMMEIRSDPTQDTVSLGGDNIYPHDYPNSVSLYLGGTWYYSTIGVPAIHLNIKNPPLGIFVDQVAQERINVYPNPTTGLLYIDNANNATVEVYNLVGERVLSASNINGSIDINDLPNGNYVVKVITDNKTATTKIAVLK